MKLLPPYREANPVCVDDILTNGTKRVNRNRCPCDRCWYNLPWYVRKDAERPTPETR